MYRKKYHIHFVGIGGIGMSGIAELLLNLGYRVSGSDMRSSDITRRLASLGGTIYENHSADAIEGADVVVKSTAVKDDNPEICAAIKKSVPVIPRAEMLAELMRLKYSVAVAGSHGKTTTTSIVSSVLHKGELDPTVVIGGKLKSLGTNAVLGSGEYIVAEADESDGSFLKFSPSIAVVTNIDAEHLDFYKDLEEIKKVFINFIDRIPFYGTAVLCLDNGPVQEILPSIKKRFITYGTTPQADLQAKDISFDEMRSRYSVYYHGEALGDIVLNLPGKHNVYNSLASIGVGLELGIDFDVIKSALESIDGVQRRLEIKWEKNKITCIDDYGHHPTEIVATLGALTDSWPERRKIVVFQPHRYSRTQALYDDFTKAFYMSDKLVVLPVYAAGEQAIKEVEGDVLAKGIAAHGHKSVVYMKDFNEAGEYLKDVLKEDDLILTLGAGDVYKIGDELLERIW